MSYQQFTLTAKQRHCSTLLSGAIGLFTPMDKYDQDARVMLKITKVTNGTFVSKM